MSALGHKRTYAAHKGMSALAPKADISSPRPHVRFVPIADRAPLFDNFICGSPFLNLYLIGARTIKGHHGSHNLRNRTNLLLTIAVVIFYAALRRSPTPSHLLMMIVLVAALCTLDLGSELINFLALTIRS